MSLMTRAYCMTRIDYRHLSDLCSDLVPKITCQVWSPGLSPAYGFECLLVPSRLAFLQRSASGTVSLRPS